MDITRARAERLHQEQDGHEFHLTRKRRNCRQPASAHAAQATPAAFTQHNQLTPLSHSHRHPKRLRPTDEPRSRRRGGGITRLVSPSSSYLSYCLPVASLPPSPPSSFASPYRTLFTLPLIPPFPSPSPQFANAHSHNTTDDTGATTTRSLGLLVARGTLLTSIAPADGSHEVANPFLQEEQ